MVWLSEFLRWSLIFIIKGFRTIVFIFIVISTTFWPIWPRAFFVEITIKMKIIVWKPLMVDCLVSLFNDKFHGLFNVKAILFFLFEEQQWYYLTLILLGYKRVCYLSQGYSSKSECNPIYPTPPLEQNMTQGQFLSGV